MKYAMGYCELRNYWMPVVFPDDVVHIIIAAALKASGFALHSAGFVTVDTDETGSRVVLSDERSESLKCGPGPQDELILTLFLLHGLSGLSLANVITLIALRHKQGVAPKDVITSLVGDPSTRGTDSVDAPPDPPKRARI